MKEHISVLLDEAIEMLNVKEDGIYVDGTLGRGGHSLEILKRLKNGKLYCFAFYRRVLPFLAACSCLFFSLRNSNAL